MGPGGLPDWLRFAFRQQDSAPKAQSLRRSAALGQLYGAILELGNFPDGIEHGIGEHIRRCFVITEWDEDGASRHSVVGTRVERDAATPRLDRDGPCGLDVQALEIE